jgi:hypothetical protein
MGTVTPTGFPRSVLPPIIVAYVPISHQGISTMCYSIYSLNILAISPERFDELGTSLPNENQEASQLWSCVLISWRYIIAYSRCAKYCRRASWGRITFRAQPDRHQVTNQWSYSLNGPQVCNLRTRFLGDIHFSPSTNSGQDFDYWVCTDELSEGLLAPRRVWLSNLPGAPHPVYHKHVLKPQDKDCPPRWILARSYSLFLAERRRLGAPCTR